MSPFDVSGKKVVVTGAARGIGYAVGRAFAMAGAEVTLLDLSDSVAEVASTLARETGQRVSGQRCDITDRASVYSVFGALGPIDVLVNNAGVCFKTAVDGPRDAVDETFDRMIDINLNGHFYVTRAAVPQMGRGGRIIFTASIWAKAAGAEYAAYCASKHGILGLTRALAMELGPRGITVNAICPGTIHTELNEKNISPADREVLLKTMVIDQGWIEPDDLANLYVFLATHAAKDITGQAYNYDRGQVMA